MPRMLAYMFPKGKYHRSRDHKITNSSTNDDDDDASDDEPTLEPTHDSGNLEKPGTGVYTTNSELVPIQILSSVVVVTWYEVT